MRYQARIGVVAMGPDSCSAIYELPVASQTPRMASDSPLYSQYPQYQPQSYTITTLFAEAHTNMQTHVMSCVSKNMSLLHALHMMPWMRKLMHRD